MPEGASDSFLQLIEASYQALRSYQFGHDEPHLAQTVADEIAICLTRVGRRPSDWEQKPGRD